MFAAVCALMLLASPTVAVAGDTPVTVTDSVAEYNRLARELHVLAARNAWSGVERTYVKIQATGAPLQFKELVSGAHSARAHGDVQEVRHRLREASKQQEERNVLEWMWEIDQSYGQVFLACEAAKKNQPELVRPVMPFDPNHRRAVEFAIETLSATCLFDGLLPAGEYGFGTHPFSVQPQIESVTLDLRASEAKVRKKPRNATE
jgi:hypothetical protein